MSAKPGEVQRAMPVGERRVALTDSANSDSIRRMITSHLVRNVVYEHAMGIIKAFVGERFVAKVPF